MEIKELITKFGFEVDEKPLHDMEAGISAIKDGLIGLGVSIGVSVGALFELAHSTAETREGMLKMSEQAGMSVETFSQLAAAAKLGHVDIEEFGMAFGILNRNLFKASQGGAEATKAFNQLGISQNQLRGVGFQTDKVLDLISNRMQAMPNGFRKSALAMEIFGRSGARMIPFLNRLKEFQEIGSKMGVGVSKEQAEQSEEFLLRLSMFEMIVRGIKNAVSGELIPVFTNIIKATNDWLLANRAIIKSNFAGFAKAMGKYLQDVFFWARQVANIFMDIVKVFGGAESATRMFLTTIGVLSSVGVLFGIGKMVQGVYGLVTALELADVAAFAVPLAIGAVIAAIALLAEDVYRYFNGDDSLLGVFIDRFPTAGKAVIEVMKFIGSAISDTFTAAIYDIKMVIGWVYELADALEHPLDTLGKLSQGIMDSADDLGKMITGGAASFLGMGPSSSPVSGTAASAGNGGNVSVTAPITVTVPPGTPPNQVGAAVQAGVGDGLGAILRSTRRSTAGGVAY